MKNLKTIQEIVKGRREASEAEVRFAGRILLQRVKELERELSECQAHKDAYYRELYPCQMS